MLHRKVKLLVRNLELRRFRQPFHSTVSTMHSATLMLILVSVVYAVTYTHQQAVDKLAAYGIAVGLPGTCSDQHNSQCVSLEGSSCFLYVVVNGRYPFRSH